MVVLLIVVSTLLLLINVKLMMSRKLMVEQESERLEAAMTEFITAVEQENDALYDKLMERLEQTEAKMAQWEKANHQTEEPKSTFPSADPPVVETNRQVKIRQLMKQGFSAAHIAKLLGLPIGEAEVAVQIEKKRQSR
jgi:DNA-binding NarL/FixJ family response regulator